MTRKRCKRKVYSTQVDAIGMAISGASLTPQQTLDKVRLLELSQIDALARGAGTLTDLRNLTDMINLCGTMADMGIGPEAEDACQAAENALLSIMKRREKWGKLEATPAELETFRECFRWHDAQRSAVPRIDYERAITLTSNRIRGAHPSVRHVI